jgi:hypothetical protein
MGISARVEPRWNPLARHRVEQLEARELAGKREPEGRSRRFLARAGNT